MDNKAVVVFKIMKRKKEYDLEIPLDISANDLVAALNTAFDLRGTSKTAIFRRSGRSLCSRATKAWRSLAFAMARSFILPDEEVRAWSMDTF